MISFAKEKLVNHVTQTPNVMIIIIDAEKIIQMAKMYALILINVANHNIAAQLC